MTNNETKQPPNLQQEEEDEEGLLRNGYDVILIGTNITNSILACALSFANRNVLHVDANDVYGDVIDGSYNLRDLHELMMNSMSSSSSSKLTCHTCTTIPKLPEMSGVNYDDVIKDVQEEVSTVYGAGVIQHAETYADYAMGSYAKYRVVEMKNWNARLYQVIHDNDDKKDGESSNLLAYHVVHAKSSDMDARRFSHKFSLDIRPKILLNNGMAVSGLINSGVCQYVEFKGVLGVYVAGQDRNKKEIRTEDARKSGKLSFHKVPSNKSDVFKCDYISNIDKRKLMRLLGTIRDFGTAKFLLSVLSTKESSTNGSESDGTDGGAQLDDNIAIVTSLNERKLNVGRSLHRPQNKLVDDTQMSLLEKCLNVSFREFLTSPEYRQKLPEYLADIVQYALAIDDGGSDLSTEEATRRLFDYINSLGKFHVDTGYLQPMYGTGEFSTSFCRSAAVHGSTYLLRRPIKRIEILNKMKDDESIDVLLGPDPDGFGASTDKVVKCRYCVMTNETYCTITQPAVEKHNEPFELVKSWRLIALLRGYFSDEQRHVIVFPPNSVDNNPMPIRAIILDSSSSITPMGYTAVHLSCILNNTSESINEYDNIAQRVLNSALDVIRLEQFNDAPTFWKAIFSRKVIGTYMTENNENGSNNLFCTPSTENFCLDEHFAQAKKIYDNIVGTDSGNFPFLFRDKTKYSNLGDESEEEDEANLKTALEAMQDRKDDS